jgi:hypothetical protein
MDEDETNARVCKPAILWCCACCLTCSQKLLVRNLPSYYLLRLHQIRQWESTVQVFTHRKYVFSVYAAAFRNIKKDQPRSKCQCKGVYNFEWKMRAWHIFTLHAATQLANFPARCALGDYHFRNKFTGCWAEEFSKPFFWDSIGRCVNARAPVR